MKKKELKKDEWKETKKKIYGEKDGGKSKVKTE